MAITRSALIALAVLVLALAQPLAARADDHLKPPSDAARAVQYARQSSSSRAEAQLLQSRVDAANAMLDILSAERNATAAQIDELGKAIAASETDLALATYQLEDARVSLARLRVEIDEQSRRLDAQELLYGEHLRVTYKQSQVSMLEMLLSATSLSGFADQLQRLLLVDRGDAALAAQIRSLRAEKVQLRDDAVARESEIVARQESISAQRAKLVEAHAVFEKVLLRADSAIAAQQTAKADAVAGRARAQLSAAIAEAAAIALTHEMEAAEAQYPGLAADLAAKSGLGVAATSKLARWPVDGIVSSPFGVRDGGFHNGLDVAAPMYTPVVAAAAGVVVTVGHPYLASGDTAEVVIIAHASNLSTLYGHLDDLQKLPPIKLGQRVEAGDVIGYVGMTGRTTGPHLHFMTIFDGKAIDPAPLLPARPTQP